MSVKIQKEVEDFVMARSGDQAPQLQFNGKYIRFGSKRNRYFFVGYTNIYKTYPFFVGVIKDWLDGDELKIIDKNEEVYKVDPEYKRAIYRASKKVKEVEVKSFDIFMDGLVDCESHPYLASKGIKGYNVKEIDNALIVPATNFLTGNITGYQMVFEKKLTEMGVEKFDVGGKTIYTKGKDTNKYNVGKLTNTYHKIGDLTDNIYVSEGYATAATIHTVTEAMSVSSFGVYNILKVAEHLAKKHEDKKVFIVLDKDCEMIPKVPKGSQVTPVCFLDKLKTKLNNSTCLNIFIIIPRFSDYTPDETDFNDLYALDQQECKDQILKGSRVNDHVISLGNDGNKVWVHSDRKGLVSLPMALKKEDLIGKVASSSYWRGISNSFSAIRERILNGSLARDFDVSKIKRTGLFRDDEGKIVINTGDKLIGEPRKGVVYLNQGVNEHYRYPDPRDYTYSDEDYASFVDNVCNLHFKEDKMAYDLIIWLAMTPFFGAQPFVTHLLMQGLSGTGKSWTIQEIIRPYLESFQINNISPATTFAAFLRKLQMQQKIFIFDEKEMGLNSQKEDDFLTAIRQVSTNKEDVVEKAEPNGTGLRTYMYDFISVLSSIKPIVFKDEDKARFIHIIFQRRKHSDKNRASLKNLRDMDLNNIALGLYRYCYDRWDDIETLKNDFYNELTGRYQIQGHPSKKVANMLAFAKVLKLFNDEKFQEYKDYLIEKEKLEERNVAEDMVDLILNREYERSGESVMDIIARSLPSEMKTLCDRGIMYKDGFLYLSRRSAAINGGVFKPYDKEINIWYNVLRAEYEVSRARFCIAGFSAHTSRIACVVIPYKIDIVQI